MNTIILNASFSLETYFFIYIFCIERLLFLLVNKPQPAVVFSIIEIYVPSSLDSYGEYAREPPADGGGSNTDGAMDVISVSFLCASKAFRLRLVYSFFMFY